MYSNSFALQKQAHWSLLFHFKEEAPASRRSYFKNGEKLRELYINFTSEVCHNCSNINKFRKSEYLRSLELDYELLNFPYDSVALDMILKEYEVDLKNFPDLRNPELQNLLAIDCSGIWKENLSEEEVLKLKQTRGIQEQFVKYTYDLELKKVLHFIHQSDAKKQESLKKGASDTADARSLQAEKHFFSLLKMKLAYCSDNGSYKLGHQLEAEGRELLKQISNCTDALATEIDTNLLLLPKAESQAYLKRLLMDLNKNIRQGEETVKDFANDASDMEAGYPADGGRPFVGSAPEIQKDLHIRKLEMLHSLSSHCQERLEIYELMSEAEKSTPRKRPSIPLVIAVLKLIGFFKLSVFSGVTQISLAAFIGWLIGKNSQNIREAIINPRMSTSLRKEAVQKIKEFFPAYDPETS